MAKKSGSSTAKSGSKSPKICRDSDTGRFLAAAERLKVANTASRDVARSKLKEMGILARNGRLSDNYK